MFPASDKKDLVVSSLYRIFAANFDFQQETQSSSNFFFKEPQKVVRVSEFRKYSQSPIQYLPTNPLPPAGTSASRGFSLFYQTAQVSLSYFTADFSAGLGTEADPLSRDKRPPPLFFSVLLLVGFQIPLRNYVEKKKKNTIYWKKKKKPRFVILMVLLKQIIFCTTPNTLRGKKI